MAESEVIMMNVFWCFYSLFTLLAALAVGRERRQVRAAPRVVFQQPVTLYFDGRRSIMGRTVNMSLSGGLIRLDDLPPELKSGDTVIVNFDYLGTGVTHVAARLIHLGKRDMRLEFDRATLQAQQTIVRAVFGRADAWMKWADRPNDTVGSSFGDLFGAIRSLFGLIMSKRRPAAPPALAQSPAAALQPAEAK